MTIYELYHKLMACIYLTVRNSNCCKCSNCIAPLPNCIASTKVHRFLSWYSDAVWQRLLYIIDIQSFTTRITTGCRTHEYAFQNAKTTENQILTQKLWLNYNLISTKLQLNSDCANSIKTFSNLMIFSFQAVWQIRKEQLHYLFNIADPASPF